MTLKLQVIIAAVIVIALIFLINMIRKRVLDLKYALVWLAVGLVVLILDIFPGIMGGMAEFLGIGLPINMLFFLGFCFSLIIIFTLTVMLSRMAERIKKLVQEVALLEKKLEALAQEEAASVVESNESRK